MSNYNYEKTFIELRELRSKAPTLPNRGSIPTDPLSDIKSLKRTFGLTMASGGIAFLYALWQNVPLIYQIHFSLQVAFTVLCLFIAWPFYWYLLTFRVNKTFDFWAYEDLTTQFALGASLFYIIQSTLLYINPLFDNLLNSLLNNQVPIEHFDWIIHRGQDFYLQWLIASTMMVIAGRVFKTMDKTNLKATTSSFRLWLGKSTGWLAKLSHGANIGPKQHIALTLEDAAQNILVLGGIGSGKTTCSIYPLLLQLVDQDCGGLIFNIKGDFDRAVKNAFNANSKEHKLKMIGENGYNVNLIEGLTPEVAASFLKSSLMLGGNQHIDNFWAETAKALCTNTLGILSFFNDSYHIKALYEYLFDKSQQELIDRKVEDLLPTLDLKQTQLLNSYCNYHKNIFARFDDKVQAGVLASVAQILSPFLHPEFSNMFCRHSDISMADVVNSTVFLVNLPLSRWGLGGKVAYNLIKLRFFNVMQERVNQPQWNQNCPVFFMCDEYQEIVSGNKDGLSDLNFWDKSRSSKTIGIVSTQSVSSFYAAIGDRDMANALLQNFRQKLCFRTEDQATLDLLNRLTGHVDVAKRTVSQQSGKSFGSKDLHSNTHCSKTETITWTTKPVLDPQLMRNLEPNQALAILVILGNSCDDVLDMKQIYA